MHSLKTMPEVRNVRNFMDAWIATNGKADPRTMLDRYFWSYLDTSYGNRMGSGYMEMDAWCDDTIGPENWYRQFNKIWFTSESELTMFKLAWSGENHG
jgi:hypothetical protein